MPVGCDCSEILPIRACQPYANHGDVTRALAALGQCTVGQIANTTDPLTTPTAALAEAFPDGFNNNCPPDTLYLRKPDGSLYVSTDQGSSWVLVGGAGGSASNVRIDGVLNNSGGTLNAGDVVIWDFAADRAVKTGTHEWFAPVAGVWQETTPAGLEGILINRGISSIRVDSAVSRGDVLIMSNALAGQATRLAVNNPEMTPSNVVVIGVALESSPGAGTVLAFVDVRQPAHYNVGVFVTKSANQSVGTGNTITVTWDQETYDTHNMHDNVTDNTRLYAPVDGVYGISSRMTVSSDIEPSGSIIVSGVDAIASHPRTVTGLVSLSTVYPLNAGQYVEVRVYHNTTVGSRSVSAAGAYFTLNLLVRRS